MPCWLPQLYVMTVRPRNSQKSTSELFRSTAPAIFFRCSAVSFGLAIALSPSEASSTRVERARFPADQVLRPDDVRLVPGAGAGLQVGHVVHAVEMADRRAGRVPLLREDPILGQQLPALQVLRLGEAGRERDADDLGGLADLDRHDVAVARLADRRVEQPPAGQVQGRVLLPVSSGRPTGRRRPSCRPSGPRRRPTSSRPRRRRSPGRSRGRRPGSPRPSPRR